MQAVWWSPDSRLLYYGVLQEGNYAYDRTSGTTTWLEVEAVLAQTPEVALNTLLPPHYRRPFISPGETRALYMVVTEAVPTPTFDPRIEGGESVDPMQEVELWVWESGESHPLGRLNQCWLRDAFWTGNEEMVVLLEFGIPMPQCDGSYAAPQAWLINLLAASTVPLFPASEHPPLQVYGFSPNGHKLLIGFFSDDTGANLQILDPEALSSVPLDAPVHDVVQWVNDEEILVSYRGESTMPPYPYGLLNIVTLDFRELTSMFADKFVGYVTLSPDQRWLAFTTGSDWFTQEDLWFMEVNLQP